MRTRCLSLWTVALLFLVVIPSHAETVKQVSMDGIYDSNAFKSAGGASDVIAQTSLYLARRDTSARSGMEYFYTGDIDLFVRSGQRHFTAHHVGLSYLRQFGEANHLFSAGWNFGGRWDRALYNYYDDVDGALYANFKLNLDPGTSLRLGYRMNIRKYLHLDASSFREHQTSLTYNTSLPTRTALKGDVSYGYKGYTMERLTTSTIIVSGPEDRRRGGGPFGQRGVPQTVVQSTLPYKSQVTLSLRVSQSVSPSTGVNVQYLRRFNPSNGGLYQSSLGTGYAEDDDLFDDRYDYQGHEVSGGMSQLLPWGSKFTVEAGYLIKDYHNKPALDLNGVSIGQDRRDRKHYLSAGVGMPLGMTSDLNLWYIYGTNTSNDPFYVYRRNHAFSFGISRKF